LTVFSSLRGEKAPDNYRFLADLIHTQFTGS
jgi:hypothetical protein